MESFIIIVMAFLSGKYEGLFRFLVILILYAIHQQIFITSFN